jgi:2-hydroxy-6-oxonona-2,4-dienedioate hydrolase
MFARSGVAQAPAGRNPVVLVHGYVASSRYMVPTLRRLAPFAPVYAPDLPGWGRSQKPRHALTVPQLADSLVAWMQVLGLRRPAILANSFGCQIVADLAMRHPDAVDRLILLGPTVDPAAKTVPRQAWRLLRDMARETMQLRAMEMADLVDQGPVLALQTLDIMMRDRIEQKLPSIAVPALVVRGSLDPICTQRWAEEAAALLPRGSLLVLPGAAHAANCSTPDLLVSAILPFLAAE